VYRVCAFLPAIGLLTAFLPTVGGAGTGADTVALQIASEASEQLVNQFDDRLGAQALDAQLDRGGPAEACPTKR
jgi:hypothetical protein